jgi:hypothetical protein
VSTGGKCVKSRVPSMPSQLKVWCGIRLVWFQEIFWVRNQLAAGGLDDLRQGCGVAEGVRQPGFLAVDVEFGQEEALALHKLPGHGLPPGMLVSDSTHMPPTGMNWPAFTFSRIRPKSSG